MKNRQMIVLTAAVMASTMLFTACGSKTEETAASTTVEAVEEVTGTVEEDASVEEASSTEEATSTEESTSTEGTTETVIEAATILSIDMFSGTEYGDLSSMEPYVDSFTVDFLFDKNDKCFGAQIVMVYSSDLDQAEKDATTEAMQAQYGECKIDGDTVTFDGAAMTGMTAADLETVSTDLIKTTYEGLGYTVTLK